MNEEKNSKYQISHPPMLYHGSANRQISEFKPTAKYVRDRAEGPVIFATPEFAFATCFLVETNDSWVNIGRFSENGTNDPLHVIISSRERFVELDHGGAVYSLPPDSFTYDKNLGMGDTEWISKVSVKPTGKQEYRSGLRAMIDAGVRVYFVDTDTFLAIQKAADDGRSILDSLTPET
jgi:hypothetical protein